MKENVQSAPYQTVNFKLRCAAYTDDKISVEGNSLPFNKILVE